MLLNCGAREDSWKPLGLQGDQTSQFLKEINPEYPLEGLMLTLKLQYFGHLIQRANSLEKLWFWERLKAGWEGDGWMASLSQWAWVWANSGRQWWTEKPGILQSMGLKRIEHNWVTEQQENKYLYLYKYNILFHNMFFKLIMMSICGCQPGFYLKKKVKHERKYLNAFHLVRQNILWDL